MGSDRHHLSQVSVDKGFFRIERLFLGNDHPYGGENQECPKDIGGKAEFFDQGNPKENHECPKDDGSQNAPKQDPVLVFLWNPERAENYGNYKNVVNAQGKLDEITCQVFHAGPHRF